jgi:hypothetical protein
MECIKARAASLDRAAPCFLSNVALGGAREELSRLFSSGRRGFAKTEQQRAMLRGLITATRVFRIFMNVVFATPAPPQPPAVLPKDSDFGPLLAEVDYARIVEEQHQQVDVLLEQLIDLMRPTVFHVDEVVLEAGDEVLWTCVVEPSMNAVHVVVEDPGTGEPVMSVPPGEFFGDWDVLSPDGVAASEDIRRYNYYVRSAAKGGPLSPWENPLPSHGSVRSIPSGSLDGLDRLCSLDALSSEPSIAEKPLSVDSDGTVVTVWQLHYEMFRLYFADAVVRHRLRWRRLVDGMPSLLGASQMLRAHLSDVFEETLILRKDLDARGVEPGDFHVLPNHLLQHSYVVVEEGQLSVRRGDAEIARLSRGDVFRLSPVAREVDELSLVLHGNLPSWRVVKIHTDDVTRSLPRELLTVLESTAMTFEGTVPLQRSFMRNPRTASQGVGV